MSQHDGKKEKDNKDITKEAEIWHAVSTNKIIQEVLDGLVFGLVWLVLFFLTYSYLGWK